MNQLQTTMDEFGGIIIKPDSLPELPDEFGLLLANALSGWKQQRYQLVWLKIPIGKSCLISVAVAAGFTFHHCHERYIMLTCRLRDQAFVPSYASHFVGVGAIVLSEQNELLVVLEKYDQVKRPHNYKLPGGLVEVGESIVAGVIREIYEETGIQTRFESLVGFGHHLHWRFERPAVYFVCRLLPLTRKLTIDKTEIAEALWMPIQEYLSNKQVNAFNKRIVEVGLEKGALRADEFDIGKKDPPYEMFFP